MSDRERDPDEIRLTRREAQVAALIVHGGLSNKAIARRLGVSIKTVEFHVDRIAQRIPGLSRPRHKITVFFLSIEEPPPIPPEGLDEDDE